MSQMVKNLPAMWETQVQSLVWEDPLMKGMATYSRYSCLENPMDSPMDRATWQVTVPGVAKSQTAAAAAAAAAAKLLRSCPTLCNPIDGSPPGSPVPGILQARTLEWVAISFSIA